MKKALVFDIFGAIIPVEYVTDLIGDEGAEGIYCAKTKSIQIDDSLENDDYMMTLIHEFFHGISDRISLNQALDERLEEIICDAFAKCIVENFEIKTK